MTRISSSLTLPLAIFFPVFWYIFFGCLTLFIGLTEAEDLPFTNAAAIKTGFVLFFLFFGALIYHFFMKLRRVEIEGQYIFITNYFKTVRLHRDAISNISSIKFLNLHRVRMQLNGKSQFGKRIYFICDSDKMKYFLQQVADQGNSTAG
ncbi:MAG TPA: hypothetical protein VFX48_04315 [Saprospiraceae bacterium]|nr:hypothetical protein [Saprospiraceae bacterium]